MNGENERDPKLDEIERMLDAAGELESEALREVEKLPRTAKESALVESFRDQLDARLAPQRSAGSPAAGESSSGRMSDGTILPSTRRPRQMLAGRIALAAAVILCATILLSRGFSVDGTGPSASIHLAGDSMLEIVRPSSLGAVPEQFACESKLGDGASYTFEFFVHLGTISAGPLLTRTTHEPLLKLTPQQRASLPPSFRLRVTGENEALGTGVHVASLDWLSH